MRPRILTIIATLSLIHCFNAVCFTQSHKPIMSEERAKAVQLAHRLETNPLGEDATEARKWLEKWIHKVPDVFELSCSHLLEDNGQSKSKYAKELTTQMKVSIAAFTIEHPDQAEDPNKRITAGIIGMLNAYGSILKIDSQAGWDFLDTLSEKQRSNELDRSVRDVMARCSEVPLSDRNKTSYRAGGTVYAPIEVSREAKIKYRPEPQYTDEAKAWNVQGRVTLQVVLASSGKVTDIEVLEGLPHGLTESCIAVARRIKFEPAVKDSQPVSTVVKLEYHFHLY